MTGASSVAGDGVCGPVGPRTGNSSGVRPGNSCGGDGWPGSCIGGGTSGRGFPGGSSCGGSDGRPGFTGGTSVGSIAIYVATYGWRRDRCRVCRCSQPCIAPCTLTRQLLGGGDVPIANGHARPLTAGMELTIEGDAASRLRQGEYHADCLLVHSGCRAVAARIVSFAKAVAGGDNRNPRDEIGRLPQRNAALMRRIRMRMRIFRSLPSRSSPRPRWAHPSAR